MIAKRIQIKILCLALIFLISGGIILSAFSIRASAEATTYSGVLEDLSKDETFNPEDYPVIPGDYSLHLITIAEGANGDLFVYVYQPVASTRNLATSINISTSVRTKNVFKNYPLELLDFSNVFFKYKVCDFTVSSDAERYYEIPSIFRSWNKDYGDEEPGAGNTVSEVSYPVAKQFVFNENTVTASDVEYIRITDKFVGYVRYRNASLGWTTRYKNFDAHFVAFDTDRKIDELLEIDVFYKQDLYTKIQKPNTSGTNYVTEEEWCDPVDKYVYIDFHQQVYAESGGFYKDNLNVFDRIQKTEDFLLQEYEYGIFKFPGFKTTEVLEFTDESYEAMLSTKWVVSFVETESYDSISFGSGVVKTVSSRVGDVSILRLKFKTDGVVYDLGVVDNKQSGSSDPSAVVDDKVPDLLEKIIAILMVGVLIWVLTLLSPFISTLLKIAWDCFKIAIQFVLGLIALPFKLIGRLFGTK